MPKIYACVWSNDKAAEMAKFYKSVFKDVRLGRTAYWGGNPRGVQEGSVLTIHLTVLGQKIMLLNGYAEMPFNESVSFVVPCGSQREIDSYWRKLTAGGGRPARCGWLIDKFGVRWQIVPSEFDRWNTSRNPRKKEAVMRAMWRMVKLDRAKLKEAFARAS